ncbi:zinc finger CCCH domain-containing protein 48-like isoform X2 [Impatiens glandulifera]|uniref:zinc finger CCCH domain-containing protein 48-like isoform X2 n=1 Tax=Impatiens glandulifera TaxID=253017 RepID=UPI001FB0E802|nr:zinc finger CCCH domain-containing protein 48-like isoform X2 [Impatiens glandulifera]
MDVDGNKEIFQRFRPSGDNRNHKVCYHWRAGKCNRFSCPFLHRELSAPYSNYNDGISLVKRSQGFSDDHNSIRRSPNFNGTSTWGRVYSGGGGSRVVTKTEKLCNFWSQGSCSFRDKCRYLHSWCTGDFSLLTQLEGHQKVVTGITMPSGSDKLYTASKDETIRLWDCQSGQCAGVINLGGEIGCMLNEGPWIFVGLPHMVKASNTQTNAMLTLGGPVGQVYSLVVGNDMLFSGTQDGTILAWKFNAAANNFEPAASLKGHNHAVVTLIVGANRLYSGSMDHSIRVWSLDNLQCLQTLADHKSVVMSILCWEQFLLSCSLDKTIKVWAATGSGNLEVTYTHNEEHRRKWGKRENEKREKPQLAGGLEVIIYRILSR